MGRVNTPKLSESERKSLENGLQTGKTHAYRKRCQVILLKADGRTSKDVGSIVGMSHVSVNTWLKRYNINGIAGLKTKTGRGRKRKINTETDTEGILESIKKHRQRLNTAKAEWENASGKSVSVSTLKSFLKVLADDIKE